MVGPTTARCSVDERRRASSGRGGGSQRREDSIMAEMISQFHIASIPTQSQKHGVLRDESCELSVPRFNKRTTINPAA